MESVSAWLAPDKARLMDHTDQETSHSAQTDWFTIHGKRTMWDEDGGGGGMPI